MAFRAESSSSRPGKDILRSWVIGELKGLEEVGTGSG